MNNKAQANIPAVFIALASLVMYILTLPLFSYLINELRLNLNPVESFVASLFPFVIFLFLFWSLVKRFGGA